jgi:chromosome segregation ATPase
MLLAWMIILTLSGLLGTGLASAQRLQIKDVPPDHWAYEAVATLIERGYLAVYEDGTFDGTRSVDRFTFAATVAKLLESVEQERATVTESDLQLLRRLSTEFRDDLVKVYASVEELDQRLAFLEEESAVRQEKITQLIALATQLEEKAHNLGALMETHKEALDQLGIDTNDLIARVKALEEEAAATKETAATKQELAQTSERQENLEQELNRLGERLAALEEDFTGELARQEQDVSASLESAVAKLSRDLDLGLEEKTVAIGLLESQLREQEKQLNLYGEQISSLDERTQALLATTEKLSGDVAGQQAELARRAEEAALLQQSIAELADALKAQGEALARADGQLVRQLTEHQDHIGRLDKGLAELAQGLQTEAAQRRQTDEQLAQLRQQVVNLNEQAILMEESLQAMGSALQEQVAHLQARLGDSELRMGDEISAQLAASMMREKKLERQLQDLEQDFANYRDRTDKELKGLKNTSTFLGVAALLGMVLGLMN